MARAKTMKVINGAYYRRIEFGGQTSGDLASANKIKSNISRYGIPTKVLPAGNKKYEVWRMD